MKIAIIGTGLAGLGAAIYLQQMIEDASFSFFDKEDRGGATSKIATGLLHPYPGKHGRLSKDGHEAYQETLRLVHYSSKYTTKQVADFTPIEKIVLDDDHFLDEHEDIIKLAPYRYLIKSSITVFTSNYLDGLYASIRNKEFIQEEIKDIKQLDRFDVVIIAAGFGVKDFIGEEVSLRYNKGQVLKARHSINRGLIGGGYIAKTEYPDIVHVGSTYEKKELSFVPKQDIAIELIQKQMRPFFPEIDQMQFIDCKAGIRVSSAHNYLPIIKRLSEKRYLFTALGSRGLLYHALFGRKLAEMIVGKK
ncbi:MAG: FAD-binding oxidoreductase [Chlamydiales bacterium]|nr:FAD-binding oxidoreductase [Chlamydiales bacterium]